MKDHVNVIIATPGHSVTTSYLKSLLATSAVFASEGITFTYTSGYSSHVADAREVTLSGTRINSLEESRPLEGNITYDTILWIDSDISWNPEDALKLIKSDKEIITGAYLLAGGESSVHPNKLQAAYRYEDIIKKTELEVIDGCGFGFLAVKQGVFEKMPRPWFQSAVAQHIIDGKSYEFNVIGEDLSWCMNVKKIGYEIWFDPTVRVNHQKTMFLTWEGIRP